MKRLEIESIKYQKKGEVLPGEEKNTSENKKNKGSAKTTIELIGLIKKYIKEQLYLIIYESLLKPIEQLQKKLVLNIISSFLFGISAIFIGIGFCLLLFLYIPPWSTFLIVGGVIFIAAISISKSKK